MVGCHVDELLEMDLDDVLFKIGAYRMKEKRYWEGWAQMLGGEQTASQHKPPKTMPESVRKRLAAMRDNG